MPTKGARGSAAGAGAGEGRRSPLGRCFAPVRLLPSVCAFGLPWTGLRSRTDSSHGLLLSEGAQAEATATGPRDGARVLRQPDFPKVSTETPSL